jgi:hypothetical protein
VSLLCPDGTAGSGRWRSTVKRIIGLLVLALLLFWVFSAPDSAANAVDNIVAILRDAAENVIRFFTQLV